METISETGGWATFLMASTAWAAEKFANVSVDDALQLLLSIGGLVFIFYKARSQKLDFEIKRLKKGELERNKKAKNEEEV